MRNLGEFVSVLHGFLHTPSDEKWLTLITCETPRPQTERARDLVNLVAFPRLLRSPFHFQNESERKRGAHKQPDGSSLSSPSSSLRPAQPLRRRHTLPRPRFEVGRSESQVSCLCVSWAEGQDLLRSVGRGAAFGCPGSSDF